mgnify:CR=1 FL=1
MNIFKIPNLGSQTFKIKAIWNVETTQDINAYIAIDSGNQLSYFTKPITKDKQIEFEFKENNEKSK